MITIKRNRAHDVVAPCLRFDSKYATWRAHLFDHDDPTNKTDDIIGVKDIHTGIIVFTFDVEQVNRFADGDKLGIEIWPDDDPTTMYWEKKAYVVEESYVPIVEEETVIFEDGYLIGAEIDEDGYIILDGISLDDFGYLKLKTV